MFLLQNCFGLTTLLPHISPSPSSNFLFTNFIPTLLLILTLITPYYQSKHIYIFLVMIWNPVLSACQKWKTKNWGLQHQIFMLVYKKQKNWRHYMENKQAMMYTLKFIPSIGTWYISTTVCSSSLRLSHKIWVTKEINGASKLHCNTSTQPTILSTAPDERISLFKNSHPQQECSESSTAAANI
jgi:hypothetical protein